MNRLEAIRQKMRDGKLAKGFFCTLSDPCVGEIAGFAGYDYLWIDAEHGPLGRQEIYRHIMAAQGSGCCAVVRVPGVDAAQMKAVLDMGPDGVIFPFINTGADARAAVAACDYPDGPYAGVRGQGPVRATRYGLDDEAEFLRTAYGKVFKVMQIETLEGWRNLDDILATPGIDCIFIGAADLGRSIAGTPGAPPIEQVYDDICTRVLAAGLTLGAAMGPTAEDAKRLHSKGVRFVVFGQDTIALARALKANLAAVEGAGV